MKNLIPVADVNNISGFPVKSSTLRKWKYLNKFPGLFISLGRKVFVDMDFLNGLFVTEAEAKDNHPSQEVIIQKAKDLSFEIEVLAGEMSHAGITDENFCSISDKTLKFAEELFKWASPSV